LAHNQISIKARCDVDSIANGLGPKQVPVTIANAIESILSLKVAAGWMSPDDLVSKNRSNAALP